MSKVATIPEMGYLEKMTYPQIVCRDVVIDVDRNLCGKDGTAGVLISLFL